MASRRRRVLTLPPGVPFLATLASGILDGRVVPDFRFDPARPDDLAAVTVYVPTRRAVRVLRSEFANLLGGRAAILPVIRPLGETDDDTGFFEAESPEILDLQDPLPNTARLLELARLILAWRNALPETVRAMHPDSPLAAPASPSDAVWLARDLSDLIDSLETEERDWEDLRQLETGDYSAWWQLTAEFLKIASHFWPARLEELKASSAARHRNALLRVEARRLAALDGHNPDPVIVAGSTGSVPATAELITAVAGIAQGAVVLPGLDLTMPDEDWAEIAPLPADGALPEPARRSHSQYGLCKLLEKLGMRRDEVLPLAEAPEDLALRQVILSHAMAPAEATSRWSAWRAGLAPDALERAFAGTALIEAANEREEAAAIAVALRLALEQPGADGPSRAALITPDRALARRVKAELARFGIEADDTAGTPLMATPQGSFTRLLLETTLRPGDPVALVSLLKHPLARFGKTPEALAPVVEALELLALRGGISSVDIADLPALVEIMRAAQAQAYHVPQWRRALPAEAPQQAADLADAIVAAIEPLCGLFLRLDGATLRQPQPLSVWAEQTGRALEAACQCPERGLRPLWADEAGDCLARLLKSIIETDGIIEADGPQWIDIMNAFMTGEAVKPRAMSHPRLFIFGTLEARLQTVDTLVLGGLNEGIWPSQPTGNPFLSRMMKTGIGLEPPERRTGQHAHDFEMANGTRQLVYSRSARQGSAPAVASRWLQRLMALGGEAFADSLRQRGAVYLRHAAALDRGASQAPAMRPAPVVDAALQPKSYSFSEVGRLRRDPYAIYARRVLKLDPVDPFNSEPGTAERGTLYHRIVDRFVREGHRAGFPEATLAMRQILAEEFDRERLPAHVDAVWRPRFARVAAAFLEWEAERTGLVERSYTEVRARLELPLLGISVTGVADRIDLKTGGRADILDYKTGSSPSVNQARTLLDPQLALEAAALEGGAFRGITARPAADLLYVRLRPGSRFKCETVNNENGRITASTTVRTATDLAASSIGELSRFVSLLKSGRQGFMSRLIPASERDYGGEYDHLARVAEWATAEPEDDAGDDQG